MTDMSMDYRRGQTAVMPDGIKVTTYMPRAQKITSLEQKAVRTRVCAYARVSTDHEEQQTSYAAQVKHYTRFIQEKAEWQFSGVYTDEGITGTSTKHREGFKQMIADAMDGKFDRIITKSVSRFARNTVDSLMTIRSLKEKGIGVWFEKENIDTLDSKGELLLTIMSSLAQEESRSISENCTWGQRKRFADGKVTLPYKQFLGYDRGEDGKPVINEEEAALVRRIYSLFLEGNTPSGIAKMLTAEGIPTPAKKAVWQNSTIASILTNEKYKGDALLQKSFTTDFLTKKSKINEGELPQYYVENSHPGVVSHEVHELVQYELRRRSEQRTRKTGQTKNGRACFANRIVCADCGSFFGSKVWHSNSKYRRIIWRCNEKYHGEKKCSTPHVTEEQIEQAFLSVVNGMVDNKDEIISTYRDIIAMLTDTAFIDRKLAELSEIVCGIEARVQQNIRQNATEPQDQDAYLKKQAAIEKQYIELQQEMKKLDEQKKERQARRARLSKVLQVFRQADCLLVDFDEKLFAALVDHVNVNKEGQITFYFADGSTR